MEEAAIRAYQGLFPNKEVDKRFSVRFSSRFNDYNANVRYTQDQLNFRLSRKWQDVSEEIVIGLFQSLMNKVFRTSVMTINIELYNIFLGKAHQGIRKTQVDPMLKESFDMLNERFFQGSVDMPNLVWGSDTRRKLGSYEFGSDTIRISSIFRDNPELRDYVMYHEMLHKKLKFNYSASRSFHHTSQFRKLEKAYPDADLLERKLRAFISGRSWQKPRPGPRSEVIQKRSRQGLIDWFFG